MPFQSYEVIFGKHQNLHPYLPPPMLSTRFRSLLRCRENCMKKNDKVFPIYDRVSHLELPGAWVSLWLSCFSTCDVQWVVVGFGAFELMEKGWMWTNMRSGFEAPKCARPLFPVVQRTQRIPTFIHVTYRFVALGGAHSPSSTVARMSTWLATGFSPVSNNDFIARGQGCSFQTLF